MGVMDWMEDPVISNMEKTGYPTSDIPNTPVCPRCKEECETIYYDKDWNICACDVCLNQSDAYDEPNCFPDGKTPW